MFASNILMGHAKTLLHCWSEFHGHICPCLIQKAPTKIDQIQKYSTVQLQCRLRQILMWNTLKSQCLPVVEVCGHDAPLRLQVAGELEAAWDEVVPGPAPALG